MWEFDINHVVGIPRISARCGPSHCSAAGGTATVISAVATLNVPYMIQQIYHTPGDYEYNNSSNTTHCVDWVPLVTLHLSLAEGSHTRDNEGLGCTALVTAK